MSLSTPDSVRKLQRALYAKAKGAPGFRFYTLYDKVYRADVLDFAYRCCRSNGGAAGVDGQTFEDIESYGLDRWLGELTGTLREKSFDRKRSVERTSRNRTAPSDRWASRRFGIAWCRRRRVW